MFSWSLELGKVTCSVGTWSLVRRFINTLQHNTENISPKNLDNIIISFKIHFHESYHFWLNLGTPGHNLLKMLMSVFPSFECLSLQYKPQWSIKSPCQFFVQILSTKWSWSLIGQGHFGIILVKEQSFKKIENIYFLSILSPLKNLANKNFI